MYLAVQEELATVGEAATALHLSRHHLFKVATSLGAIGYLDLIRGRGGGVRLACETSDINVGRVFRALEEGRVLVECLEPDPERDQCVFSGSCVLTGVFKEAYEAFCRELDGKTLADLVTERSAIKAALQHSREERNNGA